MDNSTLNSSTTEMPPESDQEEASYVEFNLELEHDELRAGQLGPTPYRNVKEEHNTSPRPVVTVQELKQLGGKLYSHIRCKQPRFGQYKSAPACLFVLDFVFIASFTKSRFTEAEVTVQVLDVEDIKSMQQGLSLLDSNEYQPRIGAWEPVMFEESTEPQVGSTTVGAGANVAAPFAVGSIQGIVARQTPFLVKGARNIQTTSDDDSRLKVFLKEDKLSRSGIFPRFSLPIVVNYTSGRKFAATVTVRTDFSFDLRLTKPLWGACDDPIWFDDTSAAATVGDELKGSETEQMRKETGLATYGGTFYPELESVHSHSAPA